MKVYIVEAHSYGADRRLAVCASIDKAKDVLKDKVEELIGGSDYSVNWYSDGLGFSDGVYDRYLITESEVLG